MKKKKRELNRSGASEGKESASAPLPRQRKHFSSQKMVGEMTGLHDPNRRKKNK